MNQRRRDLLKVLGAGSVVTLAGCSGGDGSSDETDDGSSPGDGTATESASGPPTEQVAKLVADDGDSDDEFGNSVAVSGDSTTAIIGAYGDEDPNGAEPETYTASGSAYIFDGEGGSWSQQAKLAATDGSSRDEFGSSVAISDDGTTAIVGAWVSGTTGRSIGAGAAYVFDGAGGSWSQRAKLTADDGDSRDDFGSSVVVSSDGTTALIGAPNDEDPNEARQWNIGGAGSAYVFDGTGGSWSQQAKLVGDGGVGRARFSSSVAMSDDGSTALAGAPKESNANGEKAGAAYIFNSGGGSWSRQTKLTPDDGESEDGFGSSVAMSSDGTTALITARTGAYVLESAGGSWSQQTKITVDDLGRDGDTVLITSAVLSGDGTVALIGATEITNSLGETSSSVYAFTGSGSSWSQQAMLTADDGDENDSFGHTMSMSSDSSTAILGAWSDEDPNGELAGSAYVFE